MEAVGQVQHRMRMKLRKADLIWVSLLGKTTPDIQSGQIGSGDGGGTKTFIPDPARTPRVRDLHGRVHGDVGSMPTLGKKGSSRITSYQAEKLGNASGARGVTS
jgi:hypothetical protein